MEGEKNKKNGSFAGYFLKSMIYYASWTMELWYSERGVQRSSCVGIETTDGGDQDPGNQQLQETGPGTTRNTQLNCLVSLWTRITRDGPAVGSPTRILSEIFCQRFLISFLNLLTTTVIEQVKWFPSVTILMESAGCELGLSYLQLQLHFAIYLHLHFSAPRVMFWLFCPSRHCAEYFMRILHCRHSSV